VPLVSLAVLVVLLLAAPTASAQGAPTEPVRADSSYKFWMPQLRTRCVANAEGKHFIVRPPIAYSGNGRRQWVYWRAFVYDWYLQRRIAYSHWYRGIATPTSRAPLTTNPEVVGSVNTNSVGVQVWWRVKGRWIKALKHPVRLVYRDIFGTSTFASAC
jgi:hypothetical protein